MVPSAEWRANRKLRRYSGPGVGFGEIAIDLLQARDTYMSEIPVSSTVISLMFTYRQLHVSLEMGWPAFAVTSGVQTSPSFCYPTCPAFYLVDYRQTLPYRLGEGCRPSVPNLLPESVGPGPNPLVR